MTSETPNHFKPFPLGQIVATPGALAAVPPDRLLNCLVRHTRGDWGCVSSGDAAENLLATHEGFRIHSAYAIDPAQPCQGHGENCLWIVRREVA